MSRTFYDNGAHAMNMTPSESPLMADAERELARRQKADTDLLDAIIGRAHAPLAADAGMLADVVQRQRLDMADVRQRVADHLADTDRRRRAEAAAKRLAELSSELRRRKAFASLLEAVGTADLLKAAEATVARLGGDQQIAMSWLRVRGWKWKGGTAWFWPADGKTYGINDATKRQTATDFASTQEHLHAHLATATAATEPAADATGDPDALESAVTDLEAELMALPEIDTGTERIVRLAEAGLGLFGNAEDTYLTARGWKIRGNVEAIDPRTGGRYLRRNALEAEAKRDAAPLEQHIRVSLIQEAQAILNRGLVPASAQ